MVTRAQRIKMDREATEAFMATHPPTFDGNNLEKLREWMHKIRTRFTTCHIEEHLQVDFASARLAGQALDWRIQQQGTAAHASWTGMCVVLHKRYDADAVEQERKIELYHVRTAYWGKNPNESIEDYALRFRE